MNYKNKIHTPAYKNLMAYRWGGKYNNGGVKNTKLQECMEVIQFPLLDKV